MFAQNRDRGYTLELPNPDLLCCENLYFCGFSGDGGLQTPGPPPLDPPMLAFDRGPSINGGL